MDSSMLSRAPSILIAFLLCAARFAQGMDLNALQEWSNPPSLEGWQIRASSDPETGLGTLSNPGTGGAGGPGDGYLRLTFPSRGMAGPIADTVYNGESGYAGDYQMANLLLTLSFYAEDVLPVSVLFHFHSLVSDAIWDYALDVSSAPLGSWTQYQVPFTYAAGWLGPGDATDYWNDLANIDWVGLNVAGDFANSNEQNYGVDNWQYQIPEPATCSLLAAGFVAVVVAARKRRRSP